jgi:hypothetical protein
MKMIILISFLFMCGCKKYDDGPLITFRTPESRIHGVWDVQYLFVNNVDSTYYLKSNPCWTPIEFLEKDEVGDNLISSEQGHNGCYLYGNWGFQNDNETLELLFTSQGWPPIGMWGFQTTAINWKINKLTSSDLWIETNYNNIYTWVHLEKQ